ncbi:hypothetical protein [Cellulomonas sp. URHE0023]|nr:hypothetical protein [Cellulomonas sp. URHE0023]
MLAVIATAPHHAPWSPYATDSNVASAMKDDATATKTTFARRGLLAIQRW